MPRTILVHLNVQIDDDSETRTADEIADALLEAIGKGLPADEAASLTGRNVVCPLAEEI